MTTKKDLGIDYEEAPKVSHMLQNFNREKDQFNARLQDLKNKL